MTMNYYKIQNGTLDIKVSESPLDGYTAFEVGSEPDDLKQALLADVKKQTDLKIAYKYLNATDWYYIRKLERNVDVPVEVIAKRSESVKFIQDNT